ncbi:unnamed protein product [Camellia sinensis]
MRKTSMMSALWMVIIFLSLLPHRMCFRPQHSGCPKELQVVDGDNSGVGVVGCRSACEAFGLDQYCCSGEFANPTSCRPSSYSTMFKTACSRAYNYAFDDGTSTFTCKASDYTIIFCPNLASGEGCNLVVQRDNKRFLFLDILTLECPEDYIQGIRAAYTKDFASKDITRRQIAVAAYLIDKLALRAGNEKGDDEADTVCCCTLKVENVKPMPPNILKFDFLGKDSIRYQNEVEVELPVFKSGSDDLFDKLDTKKLNAHLKELMPGLTAKVFRTYNASITLDEMGRLVTVQSRQKSYANRRRRLLVFEVGDRVFLKISPRRGLMRFGKSGKLSPRFIGPFEILERIGEVAYHLALPPQLSGVHDVFHVSMLRKYELDPSHVLDWTDLEVDEDASYEKRLVWVLDRRDQVLRGKTIPLVKVLWKHHGVEEATWERFPGKAAGVRIAGQGAPIEAAPAKKQPLRSVAAGLLSVHVIEKLKNGDTGSLPVSLIERIHILLKKVDEGKELHCLILSDLYYHLQGELDGRKIDPGPFKELCQYLVKSKFVQMYQHKYNGDLSAHAKDVYLFDSSPSKAVAETMLLCLQNANSMVLLASSKLSALKSLITILSMNEEDVFGLEYDLDLFNIVVPDFNMGAMEKIATDADYAAILGVIGHEKHTDKAATKVNAVLARDEEQGQMIESLHTSVSIP